MKGFGEKAKPRKKLNYELNKLKYQQLVNEGFKYQLQKIKQKNIINI